MAVAKLVDAQIFLGAWNVSGSHNQIAVECSVDMLDVTTFGAGATRINMGGNLGWSVNGSGYWQTGAVPNSYSDPNFFNSMGQPETPLTIAPAMTDGGLAYFLKVVQAEYSFFGAVGDVNPFSLSHQSSWYMTRGTIFLPTTQKVAAGNGVYQQIGALSGTQRLSACMHVIQFSGTTMSMTIESDDNTGFSSATPRIAFTAATGLTSEWKSQIGPITDTYFRAKWTFTGSSFTALVSVGITSV